MRFSLNPETSRKNFALLDFKNKTLKNKLRHRGNRQCKQYVI